MLEDRGGRTLAVLGIGLVLHENIVVIGKREGKQAEEDSHADVVSVDGSKEGKVCALWQGSPGWGSWKRKGNPCELGGSASKE